MLEIFSKIMVFSVKIMVFRQKYAEWPVGVPRCIKSHFKPVVDGTFPYFGMVKCKVLPPRGLYHPVLPFRSGDGRLLFPLCVLCAEAKTPECQHTDEERQWIGTWCSPEIQKALDLGYEIIELIEVWDYDKEKGQRFVRFFFSYFWNFAYFSEILHIFQHYSTPFFSDLFKDYVNTFLKLKQQADGWPSWVKTEEDKDEYIRK